MSRLRSGKRNPHRLLNPHLPNDDDIGSLTPPAPSENGRIDTNFHLLNSQLWCWCSYRTGSYNRDDVTRFATIDGIHQRRERCSSSGRPSASDEREAARELQALDRWREAERVETRHSRRQQPNGRRGAPTSAGEL